MQPIVVKYGGAALASGGPEVLLEEVAALHKAGQRVVLVHGGGPEIDKALEQRRIPTQRVAGHRVTGAATLETVEAVLCGTINKRLVRACLALGVPAAGMSGQDGPTLVARKMLGEGGVDLGFVGEIVDCDVTLVRAVLEAKFLPVIAPLAIARDGTQLYNVNADLAAAAVASALRASAFVLVTNVSRVLRDPDNSSSGIDRLTPQEARDFAATDACRSSMKPKLLAAASAVTGGAESAYVCAASPTTIASALEGEATIVAEQHIEAPPSTGSG